MTKTVYSLIIILLILTVSFADAEILVFEMSLTPAIENYVNVTRATATISNADYSNSIDLTISETIVRGMFKGLSTTTYTLEVEIFNGDELIASGSGEGEILPTDINNVEARLVYTCGNMILIVKWCPEKTITENDFYGFEIDPENNHLKLYQDIYNVEDIANDYKDAGMNWFYPHHVQFFLDESRITLDSNMVPIVDYSFGVYRNPVTSCLLAFAFYYDYLETGDKINKQGFLNNVDWLLDYSDENYYLRYEFNFNHDNFVDLEKGWISAMAQGMALGAFSMAFYLTVEPKYLEGAERIFTTLYNNTDSLWCIIIDEEDYYWLEEYPSKDICHVLNGMLSGLWGIWDYYTISYNSFALTLFNAGIKTIADHYPIWNLENQNRSKYCTHGVYKSKYHSIHLDQLEIYAEFFDIPEFWDAAICFSQGQITSVLDFDSTHEFDIVVNEFVLQQNFPNPFNLSTTIKFEVFERTNLVLSIYNELGQKVDELINRELFAGNHQIVWNATNFSAGLYFYEIRTPHFSSTKKMMLLK